MILRASIFIALSLCACAKPPANSDALEVLVTGEIDTTDPRFAQDALSMRASRLLHAGLFRMDPRDLRPVPYVAEGYTWTSPLELDVTLRADVFFHPGRSVTAKDVCATLQAVADPALKSRHRRVVEDIALCTDASATSDQGATTKRVHITLKHPHATLLSDLELPIVKAEDAYAPASSPLEGLGPFALTSKQFGELRLGPRAGSPLPMPAHSIVLRSVRDENARAMRLRGGRADIATAGFSPTLVPALATDPNLVVTSVPGANLTYLLVHARVPTELRRALSATIDREAITRGLFAGRATATACLLPQVLWAASPCSPIVRTPGALRYALTAAGAPHELTLLSSTDRFRLTIAKLIAQEAAEEGLTLHVQAIELGSLLARTNDGDFDLAILQLPEITEPNVLKTFLHSAQIPPAGPNRGRYQNTIVDALFDRAEANPIEAERRALYAAAQMILAHDLPWIPLWNEDHVVVASSRAKAFHISPEGRLLDLARMP